MFWFFPGFGIQFAGASVVGNPRTDACSSEKSRGAGETRNIASGQMC